jgi:hypothetical protein
VKRWQGGYLTDADMHAIEREMVTLCAQQGLGPLLVGFVRNYQLALTEDEARGLTAHLPEVPRWLDLFVLFRLHSDLGKLSLANAAFLRDVRTTLRVCRVMTTSTSSSPFVG